MSIYAIAFFPQPTEKKLFQNFCLPCRESSKSENTLLMKEKFKRIYNLCKFMRPMYSMYHVIPKHLKNLFFLSFCYSSNIIRNSRKKKILQNSNILGIISLSCLVFFPFSTSKSCKILSSLFKGKFITLRNVRKFFKKKVSLYV